jgi:PD-(D/E)XK nuclease superfamily
MSAVSRLDDDFASVDLDSDFAPEPTVAKEAAPSPVALVASPIAPAIAAEALPLRPDFSFSKGPLARSGCAFWLIPGVPWHDTAGDSAEMGTENHAAMHAITTYETALLAYSKSTPLGVPAPPAPKPPTLPENLGQYAMCVSARAWLEEQGLLRLPGLRAEVAFAFDLATGKGRELADPPGEPARWYADPELRAKYGVAPTEVCGRIDLLCFGMDGEGSFVRTLDYKFHFAPGAPLSARGQMELCALAVSRALGVDRVRASALHVWEEGEPVEEEVLPLDEETGEVLGPMLDAAALAKVETWLRGLAAIPANDVAIDGPHCKQRYCPARAACPVTGLAVEQLLPAETLARKKLAEPIADAGHAAWALTAGDLLIEVGKQLIARANGYADEVGGFPLQKGGEVYGGLPVVTTRPDLTVAGAIEAVRALAPGAIAEATTWTAIKRAGGAAAEKELRAALQDLGALKVSESIRYQARPMAAYQRAAYIAAAKEGAAS